MKIAVNDTPVTPTSLTVAGFCVSFRFIPVVKPFARMVMPLITLPLRTKPFLTAICFLGAPDAKTAALPGVVPTSAELMVNPFRSSVTSLESMMMPDPELTVTFPVR